MEEHASLDWNRQYRKHWIPTVVGFVFSFLMAFLLFSKSTPFTDWFQFIEDKMYDFEVRRIYQPLSSQSEVVIVGLDDASVKAEGRLPWSREKMALLVSRLKEMGASVVALDFLFPAEEPNIAERVFERIQKEGGRVENEEIAREFDYDAMFAKSLASVDSVLGMVLTWKEASIGILPPPLLTLTPKEKQIFIPEKNSYFGNIPKLQNAAKNGGFINSTPDPDAVVRVFPLIYRYGSQVFGSLSLAAVVEYLKVKKIELIARPYDEMEFLEALQLDQRLVRVDPLGRILVPYRGPALSFPQLSATDVMRNRIDPESVRGKLVFIGAAATGSGDIVSTPISQSFNGVEIHATIAQSIIDQYLPYKPGWGKGVAVAMVLLFGFILAFGLPRLGPLFMVLASGGSVGFLLFLDVWLWREERIVLGFFFPILVIGVVFLFNLIYGFIVEAKQRLVIKNVFGQYVSSEYIDLLLKEGSDIEIKGESKELSVLFSDIRGFTSLSEKMSASELMTFLNRYFTAMTEVIFEYKGTIDKYIGDAIMAFWGAPLEDLKNSEHAVRSALGMHKKLDLLNLEFEKQNKPAIHIGIGIATGKVYVGDMGSRFRRSYTVMGDTVNLGSRIEGLTKYYSARILVSEKTYLETRERFLYKKLDRVQVKGKERSELIFEPLCSIEEASSQIREEVVLQDKALDAYWKVDWDQARQLWTQLKTSGSNPKLYEMYLVRIQTAAKPEPGWNGVHKFETK